ncbi:MAG: D-alanyl-D-alanine carboxypeptidase family protein [Dermatophilaceae bacterium]|nr:D-alanyl-D-alanine carboxypeptidase family protein [Dermatophilaceae bacterium]
MTAGLATALMVGVLFTIASPASARVPPRPAIADAILTPAELTAQLQAAKVLRADLMRSGALVAAANARLELLSAQAGTLLADLAAARRAQSAAESDAALQRTRLVELGQQVQAASSALGQLASDSYMRGGGPLGDMAAILEALTAPAPEQSTNSVATVQYLVNGRTRILNRMDTLRSAQATTSARAALASSLAATASGKSLKAKSALDAVIVDQRKALKGFQSAQLGQISKAADVRGTLLRSEQAVAKVAEMRLAAILAGQDYTVLMTQSSRCGLGRSDFANGMWPAQALCPLYAAPGESLRRSAAQAFNAMSVAYQKQTGSALCVTDGYRSYAEQVAVKKARPGLAATPGTSEHGFGLAVDLCGGVQSFASPAHLWMKRYGPLYGWFHPAWAEPSGSMPEPWHWEFAS